MTPESRRLRKSSPQEDSSTGARTMLLSTEEAVALVHGEMETVLDGERTHQAVQTNLADVICGGTVAIITFYWAHSNYGYSVEFAFCVHLQKTKPIENTLLY